MKSRLIKSILFGSISSNSTSKNSNIKRRFFSNEQNYIDKWFNQIIKDESFYEKFVVSSSKRKCYFYNIDLQGRLFLEDTTPKNMTTSLKDTKILNFFFSRIRRVTTKDINVLQNMISSNTMINDDDDDDDLIKSSVIKDYPFVSPCGVELNFIRPADTPIVFHDLQEQNTINENDGKQQRQEQKLIFGGSLSQPYNPQCLAISRKTRRLYHELTNKNNINNNIKTNGKKSSTITTPLHKRRIISSNLQQHHHQQKTNPEYGLIKSSVAITISDTIIESDDDNDDFKNEIIIICNETGKTFPLKWIPEEAEAGDEYRYPYSDE